MGLEMKPALPTIPTKDRIYLLKLASLFQVDGDTGDKKITEGQLHIFGSIIMRRHNRVQIVTSTQYGKSLWVALACIVLTCIFGKVVVVVAPSKEKAKIIMRYFIEYLGSNPLFYTKLEKNSRLERLRQEENKERIMLNNGGGIFVVSTDEKNSKKSIESAMGQGAEIVIGDEYCLVSDNTEATIFRMIAGKGKDACYIKIGNPFYSAPPNSHFLRTWLQPQTYHRIFIDYKQAIAENRYNMDFINEARNKPLFDILFECLFPDLSVMDRDGYRLLVLPDQIKFGMSPARIKELIQKHKAENGGKFKIRPKLGGDIGGGGDKNVFVVRFGKFASVVADNRSNDTMTNVSVVVELMAEYDIAPEDVNLDDIGIGRGVSDRLKELGYDINPVNVGEPAVFAPESFANLKAELCWEARKWVMDEDTRLDARDEWVQLTWLKYKTLSDRKVQMEPKKDLKARAGSSPDFAEAFYLTFCDKPFIGFV
jgi:hypothetical protein